MLNDNNSKAYIKKKPETYNPSSRLSKEDIPLTSNNNLAFTGMNDSLGFSTLNNNDNEDNKLLHSDKRDTDNSLIKKKTLTDDYNENNDNNIFTSTYPSMISKKINIKPPQETNTNINRENHKFDNVTLKKHLHPSNSSGQIAKQGNINDTMNNSNIYYEQTPQDNNDPINRIPLQNSSTNSTKKNHNNSNTFSFKNFKQQQQQQQQQLRMPSPLKPNEVSKESHPLRHNHKKTYNKRDVDNYTKCKEVLIQEIIDEDELTPLPVRKEKKHPIAEHDYNQAHSAAVLIRRIEYSYHLKTCRKFKMYDSEIVYIQRWWRRVLAHRNENMLQDLIDNELRNTQQYFISEDINRYVTFLSSIEKVYDWYKIRAAFKKLYINFAHLAWYNNSCHAVNIIIRNYRKYALRCKNRGMRRLKYWLRYYAKRIYIRTIVKGRKAFEEDRRKIIRIQAMFRGFELRNKENNQLRLGRDDHPFLFYRLRYKNNHTAKSANFMQIIERWKRHVKKIKLQRAAVLTNTLQRFFFRFYFDYLLMRIIKKTNAIITLILLRPHKRFLFGTYRKSLLKIIYDRWKRVYSATKRPCLFIIRTVYKMIGLKALKPMIRKYRHRITLNNFTSLWFTYVNNEFNRSKIISYSHFKTYYNESVIITNHMHLIGKIIRRKQRSLLSKYFMFLRLKSINNTRNILLMNYAFEGIAKTIKDYLLKCYAEAKNKQMNSSLGMSLLSQCFRRNKRSYRLRRLAEGFPNKIAQLALIKWKGIIEKYNKVKTAKLYEVSRFNQRHKKQLLNHYLFRFMKNTSHPQLYKNEVAKGVQMIAPIFEKKHAKYIYHTFNKGHRKTSIKLFIKTVITLFKAKVGLYESVLISNLRHLKQKQVYRQSKARDMIHFKAKDERMVLSKYYSRWINVTIKERDMDHNDIMTHMQLNTLRKVYLKNFLLKRGSIRTALSFTKWRHAAQRRIHTSKMKTYHLKNIMNHKASNSERYLRDSLSLWRSITAQLQSNDRRISNAIKRICTLNHKKIGKELLSSLIERYSDDKRQLLKIVFSLKSNKDQQYAKVYFRKWRKVLYKQALDNSIKTIQGFIRKKTSAKHLKTMTKAISKIYNHRLFLLLKVYAYGAIIERLIKKKRRLLFQLRKWHKKASIPSR